MTTAIGTMSMMVGLFVFMDLLVRRTPIGTDRWEVREAYLTTVLLLVGVVGINM